MTYVISKRALWVSGTIMVLTWAVWTAWQIAYGLLPPSSFFILFVPQAYFCVCLVGLWRIRYLRKQRARRSGEH